MTSALAVLPDQTEWSPAQLAALRTLGVERVDRPTLDIFLATCQQTGLNPFLRQIYLQGRWDNKAGVMKWGVQTSIDGLRIVAQRSGEYEGQTLTEWCGPDGIWRDVWLDPEPPAAARAGAWRARFREPLRAVALWREYHVTGPGGFMWGKMPALMIGKVAESLALRKAFPHDLAGIYTSEEMAQGDAHPAPLTVRSAAEQEAVIAEVVRLVESATTDDELRAVWRFAQGENALDAMTAEGTVTDLIVARRQRLLAEADSEAQAQMLAEDVTGAPETAEEGQP